MSDEHYLTNDQLIDRLYGIAEDTHLDSCLRCRARFRQMQSCRARETETAVSLSFLQNQRSRIMDGLQRRKTSAPSFQVWVPAGLAALLAVGVAFQHYSAAPIQDPGITQPGEAIEAGWFEETYSTIGMIEPRAASPLHNLFSQEPAVE